MLFGASNRRAIALVCAALALASCVTRKEREAKNPPPHIDAITPDKVGVGTPFQVQPDGKSALSVLGTNLRRGSRVRINGQPLETAWGDGSALSAIVPPELFAKDGVYPVTVEVPEGQLSNAIPFVVLPQSGPAPEITQLFPATTAAGKPFNEQPRGRSALGIVGKNFLPGVVILINGEALETNFGDVDKLAALVPQKFLAQPARLTVTVRNKDGKLSAPSALVITP